MDLRYYLERRLAFIEQYYTSVAFLFVERKRLIEAGEEPFVHPYSEDGEPPFLEEWKEADESLQVLGQTCISMLSASLHLYFTTWVHRRGAPVPDTLRLTFKKEGWLSGYKAYFAQSYQMNFEDSGCNLKLLEEIILARNRVQHPASITSLSPRYSEADLEKLNSPLFVTDQEAKLLGRAGYSEKFWLMTPRITVTKERMYEAFAEIRRLSDWLELAHN